MDEWILAGDAAFMEKAKRRMEAMVRAADILILASHSSGIISEWCNRVIWLEQGKVVADGNPLEILLRYLPKKCSSRRSAQTGRFSTGHDIMAGLSTPDEKCIGTRH